MARPKPELPPCATILALADGQGRLALRVTPGARTQSVCVEQGRVLIKVRAKPTDGEANDAVLKILAKSLGIPTSRLRLLRGATGRDKLVQLID